MYDFSAGWIAVALAFAYSNGDDILLSSGVWESFQSCGIAWHVYSKKIDFKDFIGYIVAQFLGAIVGVAVLMVFSITMVWEPTDTAT